MSFAKRYWSGMRGAAKCAAAATNYMCTISSLALDQVTTALRTSLPCALYVTAPSTYDSKNEETIALPRMMSRVRASPPTEWVNSPAEALTRQQEELAKVSVPVNIL